MLPLSCYTELIIKIIYFLKNMKTRNEHLSFNKTWIIFITHSNHTIKLSIQFITHGIHISKLSIDVDIENFNAIFHLNQQLKYIIGNSCWSTPIHLISIYSQHKLLCVAMTTKHDYHSQACVFSSQRKSYHIRQF